MKQKNPNYFPRKKSEPRGIKTAKLDKIKRVLVGKMPISKRGFWESLHKNIDSVDLLGAHDA